MQEFNSKNDKYKDTNEIFKDCQVFTYQAPWLIYALNFCTNPVLYLLFISLFSSYFRL